MQAPPFPWLLSAWLLLGWRPHSLLSEAWKQPEAPGLSMHKARLRLQWPLGVPGDEKWPLIYTTTQVSTRCILPEPVRSGLGLLVLRAQSMLEGHGSWLIGSGPGSAAHKPVAMGTWCLLCSQMLSYKGSSQLPPHELSKPQPVAVSGELLPLVRLTQHEWAPRTLQTVLPHFILFI